MSNKFLIFLIGLCFLMCLPVSAVYAATSNDPCVSETVTPQAQKEFDFATTQWMLGEITSKPIAPKIYNPLPAACNPLDSIPCDLAATLCYCKALFKNPYSKPPYEPWTDPKAPKIGTPPDDKAPDVYVFAGPVVQCFTNMDTVTPDLIRTSSQYKAQLGIIPAVTVNFMKAADQYYVPIIKVILTVVVLLFGIRLTGGYVKEIKKDTYMLFFKVAGVFLFIAWAPKLYQWIIYSMQGLSYIMSQATSSLTGTGFCIGAGTIGVEANSADSGTYVGSDLWAVWDCIFGYLLIAAGTVGMAAFVLLSLKTPGIGVIIACIAFYLIISLFFAVARSIHFFLMGVLGFSFMFCMGFVFVPIVLFNSGITIQYFKKWLVITMAYALAPLILLGFMGTMLVALDVATLSGEYSIIRQMAPGSFGQSLTATGPKGINNRNNNPLFLLTVKDMHLMADDFKGFFSVELDSAKNNSGANCGSANPPTGSPSSPSSPTTPSSAANAKLTAAQGVGNNAINTNVTSTCNAKLIKATESAVGILTKILNVEQLVQFGSNSTAAINANDMQKKVAAWKVNEFLAFATAALISYIMYALIAYVPNLASDLVSQSTMSAQRLATSKFIGEEQVMSAVETARANVMPRPDANLVSGR